MAMSTEDWHSTLRTAEGRTVCGIDPRARRPVGMPGNCCVPSSRGERALSGSFRWRSAQRVAYSCELALVPKRASVGDRLTASTAQWIKERITLAKKMYRTMFQGEGGMGTAVTQ